MPFRKAGRSAALIVLALWPAAAEAGDVTLGTLVIHQPWARATPGGAQVGGGYLTIENRGTAPDRLTGGSLAAATGFELHAMTMDGGIMRMRPAGPLEIPPGKSVTLEPTGLHIMFTGLKHGLKTGDSIPGTLVFDHAGTADVAFAVGGIADKGPAGAARAPAGQAMPGMDVK